LDKDNFKFLEDDTGLPPGWKWNESHLGFDTKVLFDNAFWKRTTRNSSKEESRIEFQVSTNSINSPLKAWQQIFTVSILSSIPTDKGQQWIVIGLTSLKLFISVIFISSYQKQKDDKL
jgi:hypothetical protein